MAQALDGVLPYHTGTGVTHDDTGLLAMISLITVHWAFGARRFLFTESAPFQALAGVIQELAALGAKRLCRVVMVATVNANHGRHRGRFTRQAVAMEVVLHSDGGDAGGGCQD